MENLKPSPKQSARTTLVLPSVISPIDWTARSEKSDSRVIEVQDFRLLLGALHTGVTELGQEVVRVILDRAVDAGAFLRVVCNLPLGYRGDVLFIDWSGGGFLSSIGRGDDRVLYALAADDVDFYLSTHGIGANKQEGAQFSDNILRFASEPQQQTRAFDVPSAVQALAATASV